MLHSFVILFTFLLSSFSIFCTETIIDDCFAIHSPNHSSKVQLEGSMHNLYLLGNQAHQIWQKNPHSLDLIKDLSTVFEPVTSSFLIDLIDQVLQSDEALEQITKASYKNVTGFLKLVLAQGPKNSWKLRLHVWEQKEKEYPHNHKWDFFSKILTGYLSQTIYEKTKESCNSNQYSVREPVSLMPLLANGEKACPCRDNYMLAEKESDSYVHLRVTNNHFIGTGESYFMPYHLTHTISPGKHALTFVFTSEHVTENSEVFVPVELNGADLTKYAPSITKDELVAELQFIKKLLLQLPLSNKYLPELIHPNHNYFNRKHDMFSQSNWRETLLQQPADRHVIQLNEEERFARQLGVDHAGNILIGGQSIAANTDYLFVLLDNKMYLSPKDFAHQVHNLICHTSFTDYAPVDSAGLLKFDETGTLIKIEAYSGHYEPSLDHMLPAYQYLKDLGVNVQSAIISNYKDRV